MLEKFQSWNSSVTGTECIHFACWNAVSCEIVDYFCEFIGLKALNLQLDVSFDDNNDGISKDQSTLVQRDRSAGGLNVSISKNLSATSTPRARDNPCNVSQEVPRYCDRTPSYSHVSDLNQGDVKHGKSPSDILVDEMFGETPKQSPTRVPKSPDCLVEEVLSKSPDCLVEEVLSSGVLNSPFVTNIGE